MISWRRSHSRILTWQIPWTEEPGGLQSLGSQRVRHDWSDLAGTHTVRSDALCDRRPVTPLCASVFSPMKVKVFVAQWCLTFCEPMDCSLPGSSVHGILQARSLQQAAMPSLLQVSSQPRDWTWVSYVSCTGTQVLYLYCHLGSPPGIQ